MGFEETDNKYIVGQEVFDCTSDYYDIGIVLSFYKSDDGWEYEVCFPYFTTILKERDIATPYYCL